MPHEVIFVEVCSFTFRFDSQEQIEEAVTFYEQKLPASSREPESVYSLRGYDRGESERWFETLPLFLREEPKRQKVVKALREALALTAKRH